MKPLTLSPLQTALVTALVIFAALVCLFVGRPAFGQPLIQGARASTWVCEMNVDFPMNESDRNEKYSKINGRGIVSCHNDEGFSTEVPVVAELHWRLNSTNPSLSSEPAVRVKTKPFVIGRDPDQIYDQYLVHMNNGPSAAQDGQSTLLLKGRKNQLIMALTFAGSAEQLKALQVSDMQLSFDDHAPVLF
jgi:hypothetical protein